MPTAYVVFIFTRGARGSDSIDLQIERTSDDLARANEVWNENCGIEFVRYQIVHRTDYSIPSNTVEDVNDPRIKTLISEVKASLGGMRAIYVVYLSGDYLSTQGVVGNADPWMTNFSSTTDYVYDGHVVMSDVAVGTYALAHEVGHVLFGRFLNEEQSSFTVNDPSNPTSVHSNNPQNIMYFRIPASNPVINSLQCEVASESRVLFETPLDLTASEAEAAGARDRRKYCPFGCHDSWDEECCYCKKKREELRRINCHIEKLVRKMEPDRVRDLPLKVEKCLEKRKDPCKKYDDGKDKGKERGKSRDKGKDSKWRKGSKPRKH